MTIAYQMNSVLAYEVQTGILAEPASATIQGDGNIKIVYNSTEGRSVVWVRVNANSEWMAVEAI